MSITEYLPLNFITVLVHRPVPSTQFTVHLLIEIILPARIQYYLSTACLCVLVQSLTILVGQILLSISQTLTYYSILNVTAWTSLWIWDIEE